MSMEHPNTLYTDQELLQQAHICSNEVIEEKNSEPLINFCRDLDNALNKSHITRDQHYDTLNNLFSDLIFTSKNLGYKKLLSSIEKIGAQYFPELKKEESEAA